MRYLKLIFLAVATALVVSIAYAYPAPQGYVTDLAGILTSDRQYIDQRISDYHKKTGIEIAVVSIPTLGGISIEEYANGLFHEWGIGQKGKNNGILLLIAVKEHKTRIEVGYGLEGQLNDGFCGEIIRERMVPQFKQGQFGKGVHYALDAIFQRLGNGR